MTGSLKKIVVIGAGNVGAEIAYTCMLQNLCAEVVLIDAKEARAQAQALDINSCKPLLETKTDVHAGGYDECGNADIAVITAAARVKYGETRLDMIQKNALIMDAVMPELLKSGFAGTVIVVTNPVDVIAGYIQKEFHLEPQRVIGAGTVLDTARFCIVLAKELGVDIEAVEGMCVGEHGDAMAVLWSLVTCGGKEVLLSEEKRLQIRNDTIQSAYTIMSGKGNTSYGIANAVLKIVRALYSEEESLLTVSTLLNGQYGIQDVYVSVPTAVSEAGVRVKEINLQEKELSELRVAAETLKETQQKAKK